MIGSLAPARARRRRPTTSGAVARDQRFERREQLERSIEGLADKFISEVPGFERAKSLYEGKYKIEVASDEFLVDEEGVPRKLFSRIAFLLDTQLDHSHIGVACKKTVRSRDLESTTFRVDIACDDVREFDDYAEKQFFDFADLYFASDASPSAR